MFLVHAVDFVQFSQGRPDELLQVMELIGTCCAAPSLAVNPVGIL